MLAKYHAIEFRATIGNGFSREEEWELFFGAIMARNFTVQGKTARDDVVSMTATFVLSVFATPNASC